MITEIERLLGQYAAWLQEKTSVREVADAVEITTPYLDRHNDYLQIYVTRDNGGFRLTDDGYIIQDLDSSGCEMSSPKRRDLLRMTLNGFGIQLDGEALVVRASSDNFPLKKHNLVPAMLAVNDLFYLAVPLVSSLFLEDVGAWLRLRDIRFAPRVKFTGKTGFDHLFNFIIPASRRQPERIVQAINHPNRDKTQSVAFAWIDTREVRPEGSKAYAFLNDSSAALNAGVVEALRKYDVRPVPWTRREEVAEELAA